MSRWRPGRGPLEFRGGIVFAGLLGGPALRRVPMVLAALAVVAALGFRLFRGNIRRFDRDEILTRWA